MSASIQDRHIIWPTLWPIRNRKFKLQDLNENKPQSFKNKTLRYTVDRLSAFSGQAGFSHFSSYSFPALTIAPSDEALRQLGQMRWQVRIQKLEAFARFHLFPGIPYATIRAPNELRTVR